jgi:hypothetical protein
MKTKNLFLLTAALALAIPTLASCRPAVATEAPTVEPTALPALTSTAEPTPAPTRTATAVPQPTAVGSFPIGTFVDAEDEALRFVFTENGKWSHWIGTRLGATGTYSAEGDIYYQLTNNVGCPPTSFQFSFDGALLRFELTDESRNDPCPDRTGWYVNKTYIFSP